MFAPEAEIDIRYQDIARRIINRSLASPDHIEEYSEADGLDPQGLMNVWLALVFWFGIKSINLHHRYGTSE
jgi:hypothetical protein